MCEATFALLQTNGISDVRSDVEVRVLSRDCGDYFKVLVGNIDHSMSFSLRFTCFNFIS